MANKFVDVYLLPIKEDKLAEYLKIARLAGKVFVKNGALRYREYVSKDLDKVAEYGVRPFTKMIRLKEGEVLVYGAVEFKSEKHRDKAMKKAELDPELDPGPSYVPPFDLKRMVVGSFTVLIDIKGEDYDK